MKEEDDQVASYTGESGLVYRRRRYMAIGMYFVFAHELQSKNDHGQLFALKCDKGIRDLISFVPLAAQNTFPKFLVCGVVPLFDRPDTWKLVSVCNTSILLVCLFY